MKLLEVRFEEIAKKKGISDEEAKVIGEILADTVETLYTKNVNGIDEFVKGVFNLINISAYNEYAELKESFVIRKVRTLSEETKQKRFNEQVAKLKEKYGIKDGE